MGLREFSTGSALRSQGEIAADIALRSRLDPVENSQQRHIP
jgi:hypothetical protein